MSRATIRGLLAWSSVDGGGPARVTIGLRSGVRVEVGPMGAVLHHPWGAMRVGARPEVLSVLARLAVQAMDGEEMARLVAGERPRDDDRVEALLAQLDVVLGGLPMAVSYGVSGGTETLMTVEPISDKAPRIDAVSISPDVALSLDRFAYLRRRPEVSGVCLESPLSLHRASLGPKAAALMARIAATPLSLDQIDDPRERAVLRVLAGAGLVDVGGQREVDGDLATWSFHDLLFHARSRPGRSDEPFGAHFLHRDKSAAPAAAPPARGGPAVELAIPTFADVVARERKLTEVIEGRTSVRAYAEEPLTLSALGELLYRSARTRRVVPIRALGAYDGADHPYPTGGLAGDLEVYVSVARCNGLSPGIYHYESAAHRLRLVGDREAAAPLLAAAKTATGGDVQPQVLLTITSRFARTAWKYEAIAYALTLKHVGALLQTLYLVATSMGLGPCALGSGDAEQAARAFGLDWRVESSVGELLLGSRGEAVSPVDGFADIVDETRARERADLGGPEGGS